MADLTSQLEGMRQAAAEGALDQRRRRRRRYEGCDTAACDSPADPLSASNSTHEAQTGTYWVHNCIAEGESPRWTSRRRASHLDLDQVCPRTPASLHFVARTNKDMCFYKIM